MKYKPFWHNCRVYMKMFKYCMVDLNWIKNINSVTAADNFTGQTICGTNQENHLGQIPGTLWKDHSVPKTPKRVTNTLQTAR